MKNKTITVKATGCIKTPPDLIVLSLTLTAKHTDYATLTQLANSNLTALTAAICQAGHEKQTLKTTNFDIQAQYDGHNDPQGNWVREFTGYLHTHALSLSFPLDMPLLSRTISAIADSQTNPELEISFTVKDKSAVQDQILNLAIENAQQKAAILAKASGAALGELLHIRYTWDEMNLTSPTRFAKSAPMSASALRLDITPEDISASEHVTVIWQLLPNNDAASVHFLETKI